VWKKEASLQAPTTGHRSDKKKLEEESGFYAYQDDQIVPNICSNAEKGNKKIL
jgi:hypothetical protein